MATYNVSNASGLTSALGKAKGGDVIKLAGGNYGSVNLSAKSYSGNVTITSASDAKQAVFTKLKMKGTSNLTVDNVKFDGTGQGNGLEVSNGSNIKVVNSDFTDLRLGAYFSKVTGLTVSNNTYTDMWHDAMNFAGITNGVISKNVYRESGSHPGYTHKDFIQFWTNKTNGEAASKNVQITGNSFYSKDGETHGIFMLNEGKMGVYSNITIADNYMRSSQTHGITVADGNGVAITNNTMIKDGKLSPLINVTPNSQNIKITNNTVGSVPDQGNSSWTVANNKEVGAVGKHWTGGQSGSYVANSGSAGASTSAAIEAPETSKAPATISAPTSTSLGDGKADEFRFDGSKLAASKTSTVDNLDFGDGDTLVFIWYDQNSFHDKPGGNLLQANAAGTYVKIDSMADIKELADFSGNKVSVNANADTDVLTLSIDQGSFTHKVQLAGLADEYLSL